MMCAINICEFAICNFFWQTECQKSFIALTRRNRVEHERKEIDYVKIGCKNWPSFSEKSGSNFIRYLTLKYAGRYLI